MTLDLDSTKQEVELLNSKIQSSSEWTYSDLSENPMSSNETRVFEELIGVREVACMSTNNNTTNAVNFGIDASVVSTCFVSNVGTYWYGESFTINFATGELHYTPGHYSGDTSTQFLKK